MQTQSNDFHEAGISALAIALCKATSRDRATNQSTASISALTRRPAMGTAIAANHEQPSRLSDRSHFRPSDRAQERQNRSTASVLQQETHAISATAIGTAIATISATAIGTP